VGRNGSICACGTCFGAKGLANEPLPVLLLLLRLLLLLLLVLVLPLVVVVRVVRATKWHQFSSL